MKFTCTQCHRQASGPTFSIVVARGSWVKGSWENAHQPVELVDLLDPDEWLCRTCAAKRNRDGIAGADERRRNQGKPEG